MKKSKGKKKALWAVFGGRNGLIHRGVPSKMTWDDKFGGYWNYDGDLRCSGEGLEQSLNGDFIFASESKDIAEGFATGAKAIIGTMRLMVDSTGGE